VAEAQQPSDEDLLKALDSITVGDVLVQALVTTASIGFRRVSVEGRDLAQARLAIESLRALEPLLRDGGVEETVVRDLQLAYANAVSGEGSTHTSADAEDRDQAEA
jgi:hypothetical protein